MAYKICPNRSKISQIVNEPSKLAQDFEDFAKMAKFCQIWSHWSEKIQFLARIDYKFLHGLISRLRRMMPHHIIRRINHSGNGIRD